MGCNTNLIPPAKFREPERMITIWLRAQMTSEMGSNSSRRKRFFSFLSSNRLDWLSGLTQSPSQWVTGALSPGFKGCSLNSDFVSRNTMPATCLHGVVLNRKDNITLLSFTEGIHWYKYIRLLKNYNYINWYTRDYLVSNRPESRATGKRFKANEQLYNKDVISICPFASR
jgi:hypothetical protein